MDFNDKKYTRWLAAAQETLAAAKNDEKGKFYNWACFKVQQAIEFGLKSLLYGIGLVPFGHSVTELTGTLVDNIGDPVLKKECREKLDAECLKYLDKLIYLLDTQMHLHLDPQAIITPRKMAHKLLLVGNNSSTR